jgi:hypothetical protein
MHLTPNSWGSPVREFNRNHEPAGSPKGGQFARATTPRTGLSRDVVRVGVTSARTPGDPLHQTNRTVGIEMRALEKGLKHLKGVRGVSVKPALGQWDGGSEFSWAVSYIGNGEARKMLARLGKHWNQDAVLILRHPRAGETADAATELSFDKPVGLPARNALAGYMGSLGLGGWTWYKRNGRTTLRIVSVPQWGGSNETHRTALSTLTQKLRSQGLDHRERQLRVKAEIYARDAGAGVQSYDAVLDRD